MIILSVDYGDTRTGIAVCDKTEFLASPVTVITEKESEPLIEKITEIAKEKKAELIVVGLPVNMDGTHGERAQRCEDFAAALTEGIDQRALAVCFSCLERMRENAARMADGK